MENKSKGKGKQKLYISIIVIMALIVLGSLGVIVAEHTQPMRAEAFYKKLSAEVHTGPASVDFDLLGEKNPDVCAWIISEGTGIDYPVVQAEDGEHYRGHLFSGASNRFGCLYTDAASSDFSGKNTVIHGGAQFSSIYKYSRQDYYDLLPSVTVCTPEKTYTVLLFSGIRTDDAAGAIKTDFADSEEFGEYITWLKENSVFRSSVSVSQSDRTVTLFADNGEDSFVLVGKIA